MHMYVHVTSKYMHADLSLQADPAWAGQKLLVLRSNVVASFLKVRKQTHFHSNKEEKLILTVFEEMCFV